MRTNCNGSAVTSIADKIEGPSGPERAATRRDQVTPSWPAGIRTARWHRPASDVLNRISGEIEAVAWVWPMGFNAT